MHRAIKALLLTWFLSAHTTRTATGDELWSRPAPQTLCALPGKFDRHIDLWDALKNNEFLSWEVRGCSILLHPLSAGYHYEAVHVAAGSHASGSIYRCWCEEDAGN